MSRPALRAPWGETPRGDSPDHNESPIAASRCVAVLRFLVVGQFETDPPPGSYIRRPRMYNMGAFRCICWLETSSFVREVEEDEGV